MAEATAEGATAADPEATSAKAVWRGRGAAATAAAVMVAARAAAAEAGAGAAAAEAAAKVEGAAAAGGRVGGRTGGGGRPGRRGTRTPPQSLHTLISKLPPKEGARGAELHGTRHRASAHS